MLPDRLNAHPSWLANPRVRFVLSVLLIGHVWAIVGRPLEFATQGPFGTSPSASAIYAPVRGYSQFAYLDHGYAFFAPDPGPSHFFEALMTSKTAPPEELRFPDLAEQQPRLLYHRHFMLAEFLNDVYHPPGGPPKEISENAIASVQWMRGRNRYEAVRDSILNHLRQEHPGKDVAIRRVEHRQPGLPEFNEGGIGTRDPRLFQVLFDTIDGGPESPIVPEVIPTDGPGESQTEPAT